MSADLHAQIAALKAELRVHNRLAKILGEMTPEGAARACAFLSAKFGASEAPAVVSDRDVPAHAEVPQAFRGPKT